MALGAARRGRGHGAAAPTWTGAGTCGPGDVRLGIGPRGSFPRLPPPPALTCGLSSRVSSIGSLSIPGIVAEGGQRPVTRRPPTVPTPSHPQRLTPTHPLSQSLQPSLPRRPRQQPGDRAGNPAPSASLPRLPARSLARGDACQRGGLAGRFVGLPGFRGHAPCALALGCNWGVVSRRRARLENQSLE